MEYNRNIKKLFEYWANTPAAEKEQCEQEWAKLLYSHTAGIKHQVLSTKNKMIDIECTDLQWVAVQVKQHMEAWTYCLMSAEEAKDIYHDFRQQYPNMFKLSLCWAWG